MSPDDYMPIHEAAKLVNRDVRTLERWVLQGMPMLTLRRYRYVSREVVVFWAKNYGRRKGRARDDP